MITRLAESFVGWSLTNIAKIDDCDGVKPRQPKQQLGDDATPTMQSIAPRREWQ